MKKVFVFEQRCLAIVKQYFSVEADSEEQALKMVESGMGFSDSYTDVIDEGKYELFDQEDIPEE